MTRQQELFLVIEAACSAFHAVRYDLSPHELDHPGIVVAIRKAVVEGREAVLLA